MTEEERQALLNTPAFGPGSEEKKPEVKEEPVAEPEGEAIKEEEPAELEKESKVPYSRFKKFHDEALEYKRQAEEWRQKAEAIKPEVKEDDELPARWVKLYGDSEASREAWKEQQALNQEVILKAREEALEAVRNERYQEIENTEKNIESLDNQFELLKDYIGRDLTEKEQESVLDIVDEYSQTGRDGKYISFFPMDKAWEIYELKEQASKAPKKTARDNVASLSGNKTDGEPNAQAEKDKAFNPLDWNSYRSKL